MWDISRALGYRIRPDEILDEWRVDEILEFNAYLKLIAEEEA